MSQQELGKELHAVGSLGRCLMALLEPQSPGDPNFVFRSFLPTLRTKDRPVVQTQGQNVSLEF